MIALFLLACDITPETTDSADTAVPAPTMATCLADGGALVERAASDPWTSGLQDLELDDDGQIYVLTDDGHLLLADAADPSAWADQHTFGTSNEGDEMLDVRGETMLVNHAGVRTGAIGDGPGTWDTVSGIGGDAAVSPDGTTVAWSWPVCGIAWGVVDVATGAALTLDPAIGDQMPLAFEYLHDGRLVAAMDTTSRTGGLAVFDGLTLESITTFAGSAAYHGLLETLGDEVATTTEGDGSYATVERVDLGDGASSSVALPFRWSEQLAIAPDLSFVLGSEGELVATDGATLYDLGTWADVVDLVADPEGAWLATASTDGVLRLYGCE